MFKRTITAITTASIALASVPAHAGSSVYDWQATIDKHNERVEAGLYSAVTLGKHTNAVFRQIQGPDGYVFGNIMNDGAPLPRVKDIKKVIAASKDEGKKVIVASNDWILPSNPMFCEIAEQVMMDCGDFTVQFMRSVSNLSDEEFEAALTEQSDMLEALARTLDLTLSDGPGILERLLMDAGKDISNYAEAIAEVASLIQDEINLEALEDALNNWDATVEAYRAGMIEGHLEHFASIITVVQDNVDFLESEVARLEVELAAAKAEIVQLKGRVASLESSLAATQAALSATQAALSSAQSALADAEAANTGLENTNTNLSSQVSNIPQVQGSAYGAGKLVGAKHVAAIVAQIEGVSAISQNGIESENDVAWRLYSAVMTAISNSSGSSGSIPNIIVGLDVDWVVPTDIYGADLSKGIITINNETWIKKGSTWMAADGQDTVGSYYSTLNSMHGGSWLGNQATSKISLAAIAANAAESAYNANPTLGSNGFNWNTVFTENLNSATYSITATTKQIIDGIQASYNDGYNDGYADGFADGYKAAIAD